MIVCICLRVSDRDIAHIASRGCASFEHLQQNLCVATRCSLCRESALALSQLHSSPFAAKLGRADRVAPCETRGGPSMDGIANA